MLNLWNLSKIRSKIRKLTGRIDDGQITDSELDSYINEYYQLVFPLEVSPLELNSWFEATLTSGTDTYTLASLSFDDNYLTLNSPIYINNETVRLYLSPAEFYDTYPDTQTYDDGQPEAVLLYNNELIFRKPPDDTYINFKASSITRPEALSDDDDYPISESWGPIISYGAAIEILEDNLEVEAMQILMPMYEKHKRNISVKTHEQFSNQRAIPKF